MNERSALIAEVRGLVQTARHAAAQQINDLLMHTYSEIGITETPGHPLGLKDPHVLEFLGLETRPTYSEAELEAGIIDKLDHFLMELGKGFLFEGRQRRFTIDAEHFYVDLVFYNRHLRCFVLVDLKVGELTHQDLSQMETGVHHYDRHVKLPEEAPTIGIILCKKEHEALVEMFTLEPSCTWRVEAASSWGDVARRCRG